MANSTTHFIFFEPKTIFLQSDVNRQEDWESCFYLKAAAVYSSITKRQADAGAMPMASKLLISIAENCASAGTAQQEAPTKAPASAAKESQTQTQKSAVSSLPTSTREAVDAVYILVAVLHDLKDRSGSSPTGEKLDAQYASDRRHDAISDVVKVANQLPLPRLMATVENFQPALQKAVKSLEQAATADEGPVISSIKAFKLGFDKDSFHSAVHLFCWYYSPFYSKPPPATGLVKEVFSGKKSLLDCLHASLLDASSRSAGAGADAGRPVGPPLPTATQLVQSGQGFGAASDGKIRAQFSNATLRLPGVVFDNRLEPVVMNLLAWEREQLRGAARPLARYVTLLAELVDEEADVRALGDAGVLLGRWRREGEVVELVRRVGAFASAPLAYPAIDDEVEQVRKAYEEKVGGITVRNRRAVWSAVAARPAASAAVTALVSLLMAAIIAKWRKR